MTQRMFTLVPLGKGFNRATKFKPKHDAYSQGIVLLEIALQRTFTSKPGLGKILWNGETMKAPEEMSVEFLNFARLNVLL